MKRRIRFALLSVFLLSQGLAAQDSTFFTFNGYMRSGFGLDGKGKSLDVFMAPNSEAKYRLGNEAEAYIETVFGYGFRDDNGALFQSHLRLAYVAPTSSSNSFATTMSVREAFVSATGLLGKQPSLSFWAGQRYNRLEVHIKDYFFRDMTGFGGGFEGLALWKEIKLGLAYLGGSIDILDPDGTVRPLNQFALNKTTLDLRIYDIDIGFGKLEFILDLSDFAGDIVSLPEGDYQVLSNTGWSVSLYHEVGFEGGRNFIHAFYGTGAAENGWAIISRPMGMDIQPGDVLDPEGFRRFRLVEDLKVDFGPHYSMLGTIIYQHLDNGMPANNILKWYTAGIRPVWFFNRYFSLATELGWDYTSQQGLDSGNLFKATIAPQISPLNKILTRPVLRAYFTYAAWSDAFRGDVAPASFGAQTNGISFGLQMEVWW